MAHCEPACPPPLDDDAVVLLLVFRVDVVVGRVRQPSRQTAWRSKEKAGEEEEGRQATHQNQVTAVDESDNGEMIR